MGETGLGHREIDWPSLTQIIDNHPNSAAVLSPAGVITHENLGFRSLRLKAFQNVPSDNLFAIFTSKERRMIEDMLRNDAPSQTGRMQLNLNAAGALSSVQMMDLTCLHSRGSTIGVLCQLTNEQSMQGPKLRYLMENLDEGVWDYNIRTGSFIASKAWHDMRGLPTEQTIDMRNDDWLEDVHPDDRENLEKAIYEHSEGNAKRLVAQYRHMHKEGHWVWILCRGSVVESDADGRPLRMVGTDTDISEAMKSQQASNRLASKLRLAVEASGMGIWEFDPVTHTVHWDDRMLEMYGITDGQNARSDNLWEQHLHPEDYADTVAYAEECNRLNKDFKRDYRIVQPNGRIRHIRSMARVVNDANTTSKLIGVNIDVSDDYKKSQELEAARARLEHEALHDSLTGLGNRRALDQAASDLFARLQPGSRYAVMDIDLDYFKVLNDTLGHPAGDFVLTRVGQILKNFARDLGQAFRVGGDEFTILLEKAPDGREIGGLCQKLIEEISAPMEFEGQTCAIGACIGYAIGQGPPQSQSAIFVEADTALYAAKRAGRLTYRAYTTAIGEEFHLASNKDQDLRDALKLDQIVCFLQPQYDAETLEIVGAEALVRWQCPKRGLLSPAQFLPRAVDAGLLGAIDQHIFMRVARLQTEWMEEGLRYPSISVNVSRARLEDEKFLAETRDTLADHHDFAFELLETSYYDEPDTELLFKLDNLREMGIRIEMDDFGTGYASVKALQALRPDTVKIDRSLVAPLGTRSNQLKILQNLSKIARLEAAQVVVEGLETGAHMAAIRMLDCDVLQGYALQRPMAELEFAAVLSKAMHQEDDASKAG